MAKIIYSADGMSWRDDTPVRIDRRDLNENGRPKPGLLPVGAEVGRSPDGEEPGWVEFDNLGASSSLESACSPTCCPRRSARKSFRVMEIASGACGKSRRSSRP
jgi:hypothetical protein